MRHAAGWLSSARDRLIPKWQYAAETLAELLELLALLLIGLLGFVPWLLWRALVRLANRLKKERITDGAAEELENESRLHGNGRGKKHGADHEPTD